MIQWGYDLGFQIQGLGTHLLNVWVGAAALQTQYSPMKLGFRVEGSDSRVCTPLIKKQVLPCFSLGIFQWGQGLGCRV